MRAFADAAAHRIGMEPGNFLGVCLGVFSGLALMANGAIGKDLGAEIHPFLIAFFRSVLVVAVLLPWFARAGYARIRPSSYRLQMVNGLVFTVAFVAWFWALPRVQLDLVASIGFTSQLYAILGAILFLGETSRPWRWAALGVGFIGAMVIVRPGFVEMSPGVLVLIVTAVLFSTNRLIIKVIATRDNPETVVVWQALLSSFLTLPLAIFYWTTPSASQFAWLVALAVLTVISHYSLAWALRLGDVGAVEPTTFARLIWAAMLGYIFFGDVPNFFTILGGLIVLASIIYIARRERREGKARRAALEAAEAQAASDSG
ncbi:MAG: DMT family transporter [Alphaproteobacteria bacterium]|nr:DMT family transporter [Alphaproteobacteria bacterium]